MIKIEFLFKWGGMTLRHWGHEATRCYFGDREISGRRIRRLKVKKRGEKWKMSVSL